MIISRYQTSYHVLKNGRTFREWDEDLKEALARQSTLITLQTKKSFGDEFEISDKIYMVAEGNAFLSCIEKDGRKLILEELEEGSVFGDLDFLEEGKLNDEFLFIEPFPKSIVKICEFKKDDFLNVLSKDPNLSIQILSVVSRRVNRLERKMEELALFNLKTRLLSELIRLGQPALGKENRVKVNRKISHEKLAQIIGSVRETVSKTLAELKTEGLVFYDKKKNLIIDLVRRKKQKQG